MNTISNVNSDPSTAAAAPAASSKPAMAGYMALLIALMENADAIQNYVANGLMKLTEALTQQGLNYSNAWVDVMNADIEKINHGGKDGKPLSGNDLTIAVQNFNQHNTLSGQSQTYFNGLSSGASDTTSKTNDQASNDYQMAAQSALAIMANITASISA